MSNARDIADAGHRIIAFAHFDGGYSSFSGQPSGTAVSTIYAFNVSSIEYRGTVGTFRVNFDTDASSTKYTVLLTSSDDPNNLLGTGEIQDRNTAYVEFQFKSFSYSGSFASDFNILVLE